MRAWNAILATGVGVALTMGVATTALAEQGTIISSTSDAYPVGTSLADGAVITLDAGASMRVLTISSRMVDIAGPHNGPVPGGEQVSGSFAQNLASAVFETDEGSPAIGGVRNVGDLRPNMIVPGTVVDTAVGGNTCLREGAEFGLYRQASEDGLGDWTVGELRTPGGETVQLRWASLEYSVEWPEDVAYENGDEFSIFMANTPNPVSFTVHVLPETSDAGAFINMMAERGCTAQIQSVASQLSAS
jgi:hypothetical protein